MKEETMQYMLLIYPGETRARFDTMSEDEQAAVVDEYRALSARPAVLSSNQLEPQDTATTVRVADGQTLTTDGPFADTKEALGGYYLLEADDLDAALEIAAQIPATRMGGAVEVRP